MSRHWKFEVDVSTLGESDDEDEAVEQFACVVQTVANLLYMNRSGLTVVVGEIERN